MSAFRPTALPPAHYRLPPERLWPCTGGWRCPKCDNIICSAWQALHRSPGNWERCRGNSTIQVLDGLPEHTWLPPPRPTACWQGLGIPRGSSGPRENTEARLLPPDQPPDTEGSVGTPGWAWERPGGKGRGGSAGWNPAHPSPCQAEVEPLPAALSPDPASCLPHLITEMSSPEGSLLLLTVARYLPPAASAAILVTGGEPAGCNGAKAVRTLQLTSPIAHQ